MRIENSLINCFESEEAQRLEVWKSDSWEGEGWVTSRSDQK
jgi:hypothetical protein